MSRVQMNALFAIAVGSALALAPSIGNAQTSKDLAEAKRLFQRASGFFQVEEYRAALPLFQRAYELSGRRPSTVFGLGQCERALEMYDEAIKHFEEYLSSSPEDKVQVEETLALLRQKKIVRDQEQARKNKEAQTVREAEAAREKAAADAEAKRQEELRKAIEEVKNTKQAAPPPPVIVQLPPPETPKEESGGILSSPVFWVVTALVVVGGAAGGVFLLTQDQDGYAGSTGIILGGLDGR